MNLPIAYRPDPPIGLPEVRQSRPYTDAIVEQILATARGSETQASAQVTAAAEIAAGTIARAFASADVEGADVPPSQLAALARAVITRGEALAYWDGLRLYEVVTFDIAGPAMRDGWTYRFELDSPGGRLMSYRADANRMLHWRYSYDMGRPWYGVGPLQRAVEAGGLMANIERSLRKETGGTVGYLLPIPSDADDPTVKNLKSDLRQLNGKTSVVETTAGGWGEGRIAAPRSDYVPQRIGPAMPETMCNLHRGIQRAVIAACGVPVELVEPHDGTASREAWRRFLHGTVQPLAGMLAEELSRVMARPVTLTFGGLFASDIAGRARAFQSMVGAGMELAQAAALSGLMAEDD